MIDLHCHILPGVDDGSPDLEASLIMGRIAADSGISTILATPHCNLSRHQPNYRSPELEQRIQALAHSFRAEQIPVELLPGAEILGRWNIGELLEKRMLPTLNHSRYLLIEFPFSIPGEDMCQLLELVEEAKLVPVVAHPERYDAVQNDPALAAWLFRRGYVLQLNKSSITGKLGRGAYYCSRWLLEHGFAHVVATDAHHFQFRTPSMREALSELEELCPPPYCRLLLETNPRRIIQDRIIPPPEEDF